MNATQEILRFLIMAVCAAIVVECVRGWREQPDLWWANLPPLSWALHGVIFYGVVFWGTISPAALNLWSSALRLHAAVLLLVGVRLFLRRARGAR